MRDTPEEKKNGVCPICGKQASLKCSGCRSQFYCDKNHQRQDWPRHRSSCQAFVIRESPELGRHLVASRDLLAGEQIISEVPLVWGPAVHSDRRICVGCGVECRKCEKRCNVCLWPACEFDCAGLTDKNRHGLECRLLVAGKIIPRCELLLPIRMLILWHKKSKKWESLLMLKSHEESRGPGTEAYAEVMKICEHLQGLIAEYPACAEVLPKICGLIDVNALETMPPKGCMAIYETACLLEHSCIPNSRHSFVVDDKGRPRIIVKTLTSVKKGEHLSTMYTHALWATKARRMHLLDTKYFSCRCRRCADPTELGTHLGTLRCPHDNGLILPRDPLDFETEWSCNSCSGVLSSAEAAELNEKLEQEVDEVMGYANKLKLLELLPRLTVLLHAGHQHCITVSHSLIQLLLPDEPQKPELCKRIIETTKTLDPHGARLALYTAVALRELATCPGEDAKSLLTECVNLLSPEPPNSPGEKLRQFIEPELLRLS